MAEDNKNMALLFFMDHLMQKNGKRTIHDLSCQFGARGFTPEMREAVGTTQEGLAEFLSQFPSLFKVEGDEISINGYGEMAMGGSHAAPLLPNLHTKSRDYEQEAVEFFEQKLRKFGPELQIKSLLGHRSQAAPEMRLVSGRHLKDFAEFLQKHTEAFVVEGDRVRLKVMPEPNNPELDLDEMGQPLAGARAKQVAVEFLKETLEAQEDVPLAMELLYQRFCDRFSHSVRQEVATNPKELLQFLKLNRTIFFIRSNKVTLVKNRPEADGSDSPPIDETGYSSTSSREDSQNETITLVKSLKAAQVAIQEIVSGPLQVEGVSVLACDFKLVTLAPQSAQFLSLVVLSTHIGKRYVFDVAHSDSIVLESGLKELLESHDLLKVCHDVRRASVVLSERYGIEMQRVFDTQMAHALVHQHKYGKEGRPVSFQHLQRLYYPESLMLSDASPRAAYNRQDTMDWTVRPLSDSMLKVVVEEAKFLVPTIYMTLKSLIPPEKEIIFRHLCDEQLSSRTKPFVPAPDPVRSKQRLTPVLSRKMDPAPVAHQNGQLYTFIPPVSKCDSSTQTLSTGDITMTKVYYDQP